MRRRQKATPWFLVFAALFFVGLFPHVTLGQDKVDRAKAFILDGRHSEAIALLEGGMNKKPEDGEVHFLLGVCHLNTGNHTEAQVLLAHAVRLNPTYAPPVAREYMKAGTKQLTSGHIRKSRILFQKAIKYQPSLKTDIAREAFRQGQKLFNTGVYESADERFSVANAFDDSFGDQICDMYFSLGNSADRRRCLEFYRVASWYCSTHNEEIGLRLLEIAQSYTSQEWVELYKSEAGNYVSEDTVRSVFPAPSWKTLQAFVYMGKGLDETNSPEYHIRTVKFGKDVQEGDKIVVETEGKFKIWDAGWEECTSSCEVLVENRTDGEYLYIQGSTDRRITLKVQRFH